MSSTRPQPSWIAFDFLGVFLPRGLSAGLNYSGVATQWQGRTPVAELAKWLHGEGFHLALASNSRRRWILPWLTRAGVGELFEVILTPDDKFLKPSPEYFHELIVRCNVRPECIIFLDDGRKNVDVACKVGLRGQQCWSFSTIVAALQQEGIEIPDRILRLDRV